MSYHVYAKQNANRQDAGFSGLPPADQSAAASRGSSVPEEGWSGAL